MNQSIYGSFKRDSSGCESGKWSVANGLKFRREALVEDYLADFYCAEHRLIVEVDGDIHDLEEVKQRDTYRQQ